MMSRKALRMSDFTNKEFQRILSNPPNEIISESLLGRLNPPEEKYQACLSFGEEEHEINFEGFSLINGEVSTATFAIREEILYKIVENRDYEISFYKSQKLSFSNSLVEKINCFKYKENIYIVEFSMEKKDD